MREIHLVGRGFATEADVHDFLAHKLGFPPYYGRNLSALQDCLGDVCEPTRLLVDLVGMGTDGEGVGSGGAGAADAHMADYLRRLAGVCERAARENPSLEVVVAWPEDDE